MKRREQDGRGRRPNEKEMERNDSGHRKGRRRTGRATAVAVAVTIAMMSGVAAYAYVAARSGDSSAMLISYEGMSREEIQDELDEIVEENMMTVSVSAQPVLDGETVFVNVINDESNTFDQRFTLIQEQDGVEEALYESGVITPGETVESCEAPGIESGTAYVEVQAVVDGEDHGSPTRVEVQIVEE